VTSRFLSRAERALLTSWKPLGPILVSEPASELAPQGLGPCFPLSINSGTIDLLVSSRDSDGCQQIIHTEATVGVITPIDLASNIVLTRDSDSQFDTHGVGYPCLTTIEGVRTLLYVGWQRLDGEIPFRNEVGSAVLDDYLGTLERTKGLTLSGPEPLVGSGSCDVVEMGGRTRLLYTRFLPWEHCEGGMRHRYEIHIAERQAGSWRTGPWPAISLQGSEYALCHPSTIVFEDSVLCAFTARGDRYRLHLAVSGPDLCFHRIPGEIELTVGAHDDDMQCYPRFAWDGEDLILLYSGNRYGRDGLLAARWSGNSIQDLVTEVKRQI
jgi:hypothetical protein